jgi:hypothetical protein
MSLPSVGEISLSNIQTEFGGNIPLGFNMYYRGGALVNSNVIGIPVSGTPISFSDFRGKGRVKGVVDNISSTAQGNVVAIYHFKLCRGDYVGPIVKVRRGSDNALLDFYANTTGTLGTAIFGTGTTLSAWLNGSTGFIHTWFDQSGRAKHITQVTNASQPTIGQAGAETYMYLNANLRMSGPNVFDTTSVSNMHYVVQLKEISRGNNCLINLNGNTDFGRFSIHSPWDDGVWYFDPGSVGTDRTMSPANITSVGNKSTFSGYKSSVDGRNGFRVNQGTRYLSSSFATATVSGGILLNNSEYGTPNHYLYNVIVFKDKLATVDESYIETNM